MTDTYRFSVKLVGLDEARKHELKEFFLRTLHPTKGLEYVKQVFDAARTGSPEIVYQTNSPTDARRMAYTLATYGGYPDIDGKFDEDEL